VKLFLRLLPLAVITLLTASSLPAQTLPDVSQSLNKLADQPASHVGFIFDRSMLQAARSVLQSQGLSAERAAAALSSITFDNYRYAHPAAYTPEALASIVAAYRSAGWKHLVNARDGARDRAHDDAHDTTPNAGAAPQHGTATDLWLHFTGADIDGVTVLTRGARDMNMVQIACDLRPLDLIHLSGHFGIPKVDPNAVMVPDPKDR
jgi:hypothetical protein